MCEGCTFGVVLLALPIFVLSCIIIGPFFEQPISNEAVVLAVLIAVCLTCVALYFLIEHNKRMDIVGYAQRTKAERGHH